MGKDQGVLRIVSWNLHGAAVPGKSSREQQDRAWRHLVELGADIILLQEVEWRAIPAFSTEVWKQLKGDEIVAPSSAPWGSLVGVRAGLPLCSRTDLFSDTVFGALYGYVVAATVELPNVGPLLLASVHAPARTVADLWQLLQRPDALDLEAVQPMALAHLPPWCCDLAFHGLARHTRGQRFVVAGDWNNARLFDETVPKYAPASVQFFERFALHDWFECHKQKGERRTYFKKGGHPYQLDHSFCDLETSKHMVDCFVDEHPVVRELSDHAPLVTDFRFA